MDYINVKIPGAYAKAIDGLIREGVFSSRAEVVREALRRLLEQMKRWPFEPLEPVPRGEAEKRRALQREVSSGEA